MRGSRRSGRAGAGKRNPYLDGGGRRVYPIDIGPSAVPGRSIHAHVSQAERLRRRRLQRRRLFLKRLLTIQFVLCAGLLLALFLYRPKKDVSSSFLVYNQIPSVEASRTQTQQEEKIQGLPAEVYARHPQWTEDFLTPNEYSRPGDPLTEVKNIFVHYTANPGTSAAQNRSYFEQQKDVHKASVSSHFIIGYDGEILQIVPLDEIAYAVMTRNMDSISIECCYKAENGQFTQETYDSLITLLQWLTEAYDLESDDILRHYDCGGKKCPLYYVEHEDAWEQLKRDVDEL